MHYTLCFICFRHYDKFPNNFKYYSYRLIFLLIKTFSHTVRPAKKKRRPVVEPKSKNISHLNVFCAILDVEYQVVAACPEHKRFLKLGYQLVGLSKVSSSYSQKSPLPFSFVFKDGFFPEGVYHHFAYGMCWFGLDLHHFGLENKSVLLQSFYTAIEIFLHVSCAQYFFADSQLVYSFRHFSIRKWFERRCRSSRNYLKPPSNLFLYSFCYL